MLLTHIRTLARGSKEFHSSVDLVSETLTVNLGSTVHSFSLPVEELRAGFGQGELGLIITRRLSNDELGVYVYDTADPTAIQNFREEFPGADRVLYAVFPAGSTRWIDPGVRVITREVSEEFDRPSGDIQIFTNEPFDFESEADRVSWSQYFLEGNNPWLKGFLFPEKVSVYAKAV